MEVFLIVILAVLLFATWRSSRNRTEQLRNDLEGLRLEIGSLRSQLAALMRSQAAGSPSVPTASAVESPAKQPAIVPPLASQPEPARSVPPPQAAAQHAPRPAAAAFQATPPARTVAPQVTMQALSPANPKPTASAERPGPAEAEENEASPSSIFSLEQTLGANWLNKLGIAILVIGLAFFLAYKLQTWGPGGKVFCGYCVSIALLAGGVWLERKPVYRIFARGGLGGGWALAFFTTYAMYHVAAAHVLSSLILDLVLMLIVAAGMVAHSLRYQSQTVTALGFLLGFITLLTSHLEAAGGTVVFSLAASAVLAIGLVVVTTLRHWVWLELTGLMAVYLTHLVWLTRVLPENHLEFAEFWPSTLLILLYWLIFRIAYVLRVPRDQREENVSSLAAVLNSIGVLGLLKYEAAHPEWAFWALMALGAVEMGLAFQVRSRRRQAFVVLSTIATVLLVSAVPFRFHGVSWPVLWLVQAHVLAVCGLRLGEPVFRRLGLLAGVVTGGVLAFHDVLPLLLIRLDSPDPGRHVSLTVALALAAALYWIHAEVYPRRWPQIAEDGREALALRITSWLGAAAATAALWVALPDLWVPVGWLALVVLLGFVADWIKAKALAMQADVMAVGALIGLFVWDAWTAGWWDHRVPMLTAIVLIYGGMRRSTVPSGAGNYVAPAYSWVATLLLAFVVADISSAAALTPVWVMLGLAPFEIGCLSRKGFLRWQGFLLVALAFGRFLFEISGIVNNSPGAPPGANHFSLVNSLLLELLILAAAGYWLLERTRNRERCTRAEHIAGLLANALGTLSIALWFANRFPSDYVPVPGGDSWVTAIWAGMATIFLALAWLARRRVYLVQALALAVAAVARGLVLDLFAGAPSGFWHGPLFHLGITAAILLAALPFAFRLRAANVFSVSEISLPADIDLILRCPEQWFFFAAFSLEAITLAFKLSSGHITIAWSLLGLVVFLFALLVGVRSYRLAGLGLLLLSVAKILLMDVWKLSPSDRYTTLIVLGLALLAVSFLYTRFAATIRRFL